MPAAVVVLVGGVGDDGGDASRSRAASSCVASRRFRVLHTHGNLPGGGHSTDRDCSKSRSLDCVDLRLEASV